MIGTDRAESEVLRGIRTAKASMDRVGKLADDFAAEKARRTRTALGLAHDALAIVSMTARGRTTDALAIADRLARAAAEFRASLG